MRTLPLLLPLLLLLVPAPFCRARENGTPAPYSLETELDAYYSNIGLYFNLTDTPIPHAAPDEGELDIYRSLFFGSRPRFMLLEASVNPLPCLGLFIRNNYENFYENSQASEDLNLVKSLTAGFEEPYALSLFLGDVVTFTRPDESSRVSNKGFMGYLVSTGNYHIRNNVAISDNWLELEWKVKGDRRNEWQNLHWSFRGGAKLHHHPEIRDTFYFSLRRSRIDYAGKILSWLDNSGFQYTMSFDAANFRMVENIFFVSKTWPLHKPAALTLDLGFIIDNNRKYSGALLEQGDDNNFTLIFRPNLTF